MIISTNQYLTFQLDDEIYALNVGNAQEIVEAPRLTAMPNAPDWIRGVMNLRGRVLPVIDLKQKFSMGVTEITRKSCVLIVEFEADDERVVIGVLVDAVLEVFELEPEAIEEPPKFGSRYSRKYLKGVGRRGERVFIILQAEKVFADVEMELATNASPVAEDEDTAASAEAPALNSEGNSHAMG